MILIINNKFGARAVMRCPLVSLVKWDKKQRRSEFVRVKKGRV